MKNYVGKVYGVYEDKILISMFKSEFFNFNSKGKSYRFNGMNSYVVIDYNLKSKIYFKINSMYFKERPLSRDVNAKYEDITLCSAYPIGESENEKFEFGVINFPMVNNFVRLADDDEIKKIMQNSDEAKNFLEIGTSPFFDFSCKIDMDPIFSNHSAILGNSGSGKSTTLRSIIGELDSKFDNMNIIIFDLHREYWNYQDKDLNAKIFKSSKLIKVLNDIRIPLKEMEFEDWVNLVLPSSAVQIPILRQALYISSYLDKNIQHRSAIYAYIIEQIFYNSGIDNLNKRSKILGISKKIDSDFNSWLNENYEGVFGKIGKQNGIYPNNFDNKEDDFKSKINKIMQELNFKFTDFINWNDMTFKNIDLIEEGVEISLLLEECKGNSQARSHCQTLITRIGILIKDFEILKYDESKILNFYNLFENESIKILNFDDFEDDKIVFFASLFLNYLYKKQKSNRSIDNLKIYNIIFDEAHRYIRNSKSEEDISTKTFEKIAKEGRKFNIFLFLSSQRPGELSRTVLSQCNNFILHRIRSDVDLEQIRKSIPFFNENEITRLSFLPKGVAVFAGEFFNVPIEIRIDASDKYKNISNNVTPSKIWKKIESENN